MAVGTTADVDLKTPVENRDAGDNMSEDLPELAERRTAAPPDVFKTGEIEHGTIAQRGKTRKKDEDK